MLHILLEVVLALLAVAVAGTSVLAWRLAQGPVELDWLARRLEAAANADSGDTKLRIGAAGLAWEGFNHGVDRPLDIRVTDLGVVQGGASLIDVPSAEVSLSVGRLLRGQLRPRAIEIDRPRLTLTRDPDGTTRLDLGGMTPAAATVPAAAHQSETPLAALLEEFGQPQQGDAATARGSRLSQLRLLRIRDAAITVHDRQLGTAWAVPSAEIDLTRRPHGGVEGSAEATVAFGAANIHLTGLAAVASGGHVTTVSLRFAPVSPALLAGAAPLLAPLAAVQAPVDGEVALDFDAGPVLSRASLRLRALPGTLHFGQETVPLGGGSLVADGNADALTVSTLRVELPHPIGPPSVLRAEGSLQRSEHGYAAALTLDLDQLGFADLPAVWPEGVGGPGARPWIVQNITAGIARNAHVQAALEIPEDLSDIDLKSASGTLDGDDLTVWWLRPIAPVEHVQARLTIVDPDSLEIAARTGRQAGTALQVHDARIRITGIEQPHQQGAIETTITGPIADAIAVLREPRLHLLDRHPVDLRDPGGQANMKLTVTLPLEAAVTMDQIAVHTHGTLSDAHLSGIVAGHDLDRGQLDLSAGNDGMKIAGKAQLAGIPADLTAEMDFRSGPPSQVLQKLTVAGRTDAAALAGAGMPANDVLRGPVDLQATLSERRDGRGDVSVRADLRDAVVDLSPLGWRKEAGQAGSASASVRLSHDALAGIDDIAAESAGLAIRGTAAMVGGQPSALRLSQVAIGRTQAQGEVRFGTGAAGRPAPVAMTVSGPIIDLSARLSHNGTTPGARAAADSNAPGRPWTLDARFDRALLAEDRQVAGLSLQAQNDGAVIRSLRLAGRLGSSNPLQLTIDPVAGGRRLSARAEDAGALLAGFNVFDRLEGGKLTVSGTYDDARPDRPLTGSAEIDSFRIRNAPGLGKVLQGMSLYGLVDALSGPGLNFSRLVAPFRLTDDTLELNDARAFSSSLGLTMQGRMDRVRSLVDLRGTIVPAYMINSLLGKVPLLGRLFSPEKGGGLFAAEYSINGPFADPHVAVNPLAALTPGALRGLFGMF